MGKLSQQDVLDMRRDLCVRHLDDVILDAIRYAVEATNGSVPIAALLLGSSAPTLRTRMRDGYSDGRIPKETIYLNPDRQRMSKFDWSECDVPKKKDAKR